MTGFDPYKNKLGGYSEQDGTIEFFGRINAIIDPSMTVLDIGAGRGAWYYEEPCAAIRKLQDLKPRVKRLIGADVDVAVMGNPTTHENMMIVGGRIPLPDASVDMIVADYVLEHVENPRTFRDEIDRVLKPGGYFCARTPHKCEYVSIAARLIRNPLHSRVLSVVQRDRKAIDVFPTFYRLNRLCHIKQVFASYKNYNYLYTSEPTYYFNNRFMFGFLSILHRFLPKVFVSNIFVFMQKPQ